MSVTFRPQLFDAVRALQAKSESTAVLFDWDGTFADSTEANFAAMAHVVSAHGIDLDHGWFVRNSGVSAADMVRLLLPQISDTHVEELARQRNRVFVSLGDSVRPFADAVDAVRHCQAAGLRTAVASGGTRATIVAFLERWNFVSNFDVVVAREDVADGKPSPDIFLHAARLLDVTPSECIVIEDSDQGVEAAHRAGMACLDVRNFRPSPGNFAPLRSDSESGVPPVGTLGM